MAGTKDRGRSVARTSNARVKVTPPVLAPWRSPSNLKVTHPVQVKSLRVVMRNVHKHGKGRAHTLLVHGERCDLTITIWGNGPNADHADVARTSTRMRERCTCEPLVMYTGAMA